MGKIIEAHNRLFKNIFVCKKCKSKQRADPLKILSGKVKCRKCQSNTFRPLRKK